MKRIASLLVLVHIVFTCSGQTRAAEFEAVIRSGNSARAFEFVRNMFRVPSTKDPFLHFKERGIKQLISFYEHSERRIEATSLIKFNQTREFWKNYSEQFTAGKWNYKSLYKNDSIAWLAANYSITLMYVHEMGHYMSLNTFHDFSDDYTCEEVVANECLAAFANHFKNNKNLSFHKQLFLSLARQTYTLIPDSTKTDFYTPLDKWCAPNPMNDFFKYYGSDELRFLRLYGYSQFRMMEQTLMHYKGETWSGFLNNRFFRFYNTYTGAGNFKPLRYKISEKKDFRDASGVKAYIGLAKKQTGNFFYTYILTGIRYLLGADGRVLQTGISEEKKNVGDTSASNNFSRYHLQNKEITDSSSTLLHQFVFTDSVPNSLSPGKSFNSDLEINSSFQNDSNHYYLVRGSYSVITDESLSVDSSYSRYEFVNLARENNRFYYRRFFLPDSLHNNDQMEEQEILLAGINNGNTVLISNELTPEHRQIISIYPVNIDSLRIEPAIWQGRTDKKGFFNMMYPSVYLDEKAGAIYLCFWNPVTSKTYLLKITEKETSGFELYHDSYMGEYGPQMRVTALRLVDSNKLFLFAKTRSPGNSSEPRMQRLLLKW